MDDKVYKILTAAEWNRFRETGRFSGSADDLRDGFIHLSTRRQIDGVIEKFFTGKGRLFIAEFSNPMLLERLKWEKSDTGEIYPHLYGMNILLGEVASCTEV